MINYPRTIGYHRQHGAALMVMLIVLVLGVAATLAGSLNSAALKNDSQKANELALAQAKEALIGYALTYADSHPGKTLGYLPCPDRDGNAGGNDEGSSSTCSGVGSEIGRLPWRTLHLPTLRDGNGECLWYAVSGSYKNNSTAFMNWDNKGQLKMYDSNGAEISPDEVVALVISPGARTTNNSSRSGNDAPICGGNYDSAAYLDNDIEHMINNASISSAKFILPHEHRDTNGSVTLTTNDQFLTITRQDIWASVQARIAKEAKQCLDEYALHSGNKYPWAVPLETPTSFTPLMTGEYSTRFGRIPVRPSIQTDSTPSNIKNLQSTFAHLWTALITFSNNKNTSNLSILSSAASNAKNAADAVKDDYNETILETPARNLKNIAEDIRDNLTTSSSNSTLDAFQQSLTNSARTFTAAMADRFPQASGMSDTWPSTCELFISPQWDHWRDYLFYHVANGYKPGSSASCSSSCLSAQQSNTAMPGSGKYQAIVVGAGKSLSNTTRVTNNLSDYLEADNRLPQNDSTKPYKTYRSSDGEFSANNDLILCLNGSTQCPQ